MNRKRIKINEMALMSVMAAVLCIIGPVTIPVGMVPVSLLPVVLYLSVYILGIWKSAGSCLIYICIGLIGIPVFSGYSGGPGVLFGPTGGYILGYLLLTLCSGFFIEKKVKKWWHLLGMVLGLLLCYLLGTIWLMIVMQMTLVQAFLTGVAPFIVFDLLKVAAVFLIGPVFRRHLKKANLID